MSLPHVINVFSDIQMKTAAFRLHPYTNFPTNPKEGELSVVDGALYSYVFLEGSLQWVPLTNQREYAIHYQDVASTSWIVEHNLGTTDFIYAVYDENNNLQIADLTILSLDSIQINLSTAMIGKAIIIGASTKFAGYQSCSDTQSVYDSISYGTTEPTGAETSTLYFQVGV